MTANRTKLARLTRSGVRARLPSPDDVQRIWGEKDITSKRTVVSSIIARIEISRHPAGLASTRTRRELEGLTTLPNDSTCTAPSSFADVCASCDGSERRC